MAWYSSLIDTISDYAKSKLRQLESLFTKGLAPQQANHIIKQTSSIQEYDRRGLLPWEAYQLWAQFKEARDESITSLPSMRSERLYAYQAVPTHFLSPMQHRYLLDYSYTMKNPVTGELSTHNSTMGFRRLARWGSILNRMEERITAMVEVAERGDNYLLLQKLEYVPGSISVTGFFRTQNN